MIRFTCPQCDRNLRADPDLAGEDCVCPKCGGKCVVPATTGEPAEVVYCSVTLRSVQIPINAFQLPKMCLGCGRDSQEKPLNITLMSHKKSLLEKVEEAALRSAISGAVGLAGHAIVGDAFGHTGYAVAKGIADSNEPFPLFISVPSCGKCGAEEMKDVRLTGVDAEGITIAGVPSRFAAAAVALEQAIAERAADIFKQVMTRGTPNDGAKPAKDGDFDWSQIGK